MGVLNSVWNEPSGRQIAVTIDENLAVLACRNFMPARGGDALEFAGVEFHGIEMAFGGCLEPPGQQSLLVVRLHDAVDVPCTASELLPFAVADPVEVTEPVAFGCPQVVGLADRPEVVGQVDPGLRGFLDQQACPWPAPSNKLDAQAVLSPVLHTQDEIGAGEGGPRQIVVRVIRIVEPGGFSGIQLVPPELNGGIGGTGKRVALLDRFEFVATEPVDPANRGNVDAGKGNRIVARAPPVAVVAVHFFLGQKVCGPETDRGVLRPADGALDAACEVQIKQAAVSAVADVSGLRRQPDVRVSAAGGRHLAGRSGGRVEEVSGARRLDEQRAAVGTPGMT